MARGGGADERALAAIRRLRAVQEDGPRLTLPEFKTLVREQYFMLLIDEEATLGAIPDLLPSDGQVRRRAFTSLGKILSARGEIAGEALKRLERVAQLFGVDAKLAAPSAGSEKIAKAS
jgi:hypothetical protein